jgi:hypothetical protein
MPTLGQQKKLQNIDNKKDTPHAVNLLASLASSGTKGSIQRFLVLFFLVILLAAASNQQRDDEGDTSKTSDNASN